MNNKNLFMQLDDKYIKELIILKLKKYYEFVKGREYKKFTYKFNNYLWIFRFYRNVIKNCIRKSS